MNQFRNSKYYAKLREFEINLNFIGEKTMGNKQFKNGDQVFHFLPDSSSSEYGFISIIVNGNIFCRFWSGMMLGSIRNISTGELCSKENLRLTGQNVPQEIISAWLKFLNK